MSRLYADGSEKGHTASRMAIPANVALTGGDCGRMMIRNKEYI